MTFVRRAAEIVFALAFVAFVLIIGHQHFFRGAASPAASQEPALERRAQTQTHLLDDIAVDRSGLAAVERRLARPLRHLPNRLIAAEEPAGSSPTGAAISPTPPRPLPPETNATPISPAGPELPLVVNPQPVNSEGAKSPSREAESKSAMNTESDSDDVADVEAPLNSDVDTKKRKIIEKGLPGSTAEERDEWHDNLKDFSAHDLREVLRLHKELGGLPRHGSELLHRRMPQAVTSRQQPTVDLDKQVTLRDSAFGPQWDTGEQQVVQQTLAAISRARRVLVNNIANLNTVGFKRSTVSFETAFEEAAERRPLGARIGPSLLDLSQGHLEQTGRRFDLAIDGEGFFQLKPLVTRSPVLKAAGTKLPAGENDKIYYTRAGRFSVNVDGRVVLKTSKSEWALEPPILVAPGCSEIHVSENGEVRAVAPPDGEWTIVGALELARFADPSDLVPCGENVYSSVRPLGDDSVGTPNSDGIGRIREGALESSNVDLRQELKELEQIEKSRHALEAAARMTQEARPFSNERANDEDSPNVPSTK